MESRDNSFPPGSVATNGSRRSGQSCPTHITKRGELYCLTCELVVCSECLIGSREHFRHSIDSVRDTYAGRLQETRVKIELLNKHIKSLCRKAEEGLLLLETVRRDEASVLERLDRIWADAREQVAGISKKYAEQLEPFLLTTKLKRHNRDLLVGKISSLSEGEFLAQQADLMNQCDGLINSSSYVIPEPPNANGSIVCSLLPTLEVSVHDFYIRQRNQTVSTVDRYGIQWNLQLERTNKFQLHIDTKELVDLEGNFMVIFEIIGNLPTKTVKLRIPFKLPNKSSSHQITKILASDFSQLKDFVNKEGLLKIKYGIGPEDPIAERSCYEFSLKHYKTKLEFAESELTEWKHFNVGHFIMVQCPPPGSKQRKTQESVGILDENGVRWQLRVSINGKKGVGFVGAFLTKCTGGFEGWYDYFIELVHLRSEQKNRLLKGCCLFNKCRKLEFPQYMTVAFLDQFLNNDTLRFRFGTKLAK